MSCNLFVYLVLLSGRIYWLVAEVLIILVKWYSTVLSSHT